MEKLSALNESDNASPSLEVFLSLAGRYRLSAVETSLLGQAARDASESDWEAAVEKTIYQETGGLLSHHLREAGVTPPGALRKEYRWIALSNTMIEAELMRIVPSLAEAELRILLIKGTALHQSVYRNPGVRNFEDADWVLSCETDAKKAERVLAALGYKSSGGDEDAHWTHGPYIIELHRNAVGDERVAARLSGLKTEAGKINAEVWARARPAAMGLPYLMPAPEDHLLILCAHLMKHNFEPGIWFVDLEALLTETPRFDWPAALERARRWGLLRPLAFAFRNLDKFRGGDTGVYLPAEVREEFASVRPTMLERNLLFLASRGKTLSGEKEEWERVPIGNLLWLSSQTTLWAKACLLREAAFPAGGAMSEIYPGYRSALRWWFMVRRAADLFRLGVRVLRLSRRKDD